MSKGRVMRSVVVNRDPEQVQREMAQTQVPVRLLEAADIAQGDGTSLRVANLLLYRSAVQFELIASVEPEAFECVHLPAEGPLDLAGWIDEPARDVVVGIAVDGRALPVVPMQGRWPARQGHRSVLVIDSEGFIDAGGARTSVTYWVPLVPAEHLVVTARAPGLDLSGELRLSATEWPGLVTDVGSR